MGKRVGEKKGWGRGREVDVTLHAPTPKRFTLPASRAALGHSGTIHMLLLGPAMCYRCAKALDSTDVCNTFFLSKGLVQLMRQCQLRLLVL